MLYGRPLKASSKEVYRALQKAYVKQAPMLSGKERLVDISGSQSGGRGVEINHAEEKRFTAGDASDGQGSYSLLRYYSRV